MKNAPQAISLIVGIALCFSALAIDIPQPWIGLLMLLALLCFGFHIGWIFSDREGGE